MRGKKVRVIDELMLEIGPKRVSVERIDWEVETKDI